MIPDYLKLPENTSQKKWGTLEKKDKLWYVEGHPYMISMAKRLFPGSRGSSRSHGSATFPATKRVIGDLNWFMHRFPLDVENIAEWQKELGTAQEHFQKQEAILEMPTKIAPSPKFKGKLLEFQKEGLAFLLHNPRSLLADQMGLGKSMPLDSFLLTPDGWILMKHIQIGNYVIGQDGTGKKVIGVYPQGKRPVYRVTFSDNTFVECDEEHIWAVQTANQRFGTGNYRNLTLKQIMEWGIKYDNSNSLHFIPMILPIQFEKRELLLEPYVMGCLLGDGGLSCNTILFSTADVEILDIIKPLLPENIKIKKKKGMNCDYKFLIKNKKNNSDRNQLVKIVDYYGLLYKKSDQKFIPEEYKFSDISDRTRLLQGLLDTDGSVTKCDNHIEYASASKMLATDVKFLVESLGGTAKLRSRIPWYTYKGVKKEGKISYRLTIALSPQIKPFKLRRKADIYHPREKYQPYRAIKKIEYVGEKDCQCIKVDSEDGLYVTDHCIVTHNTPVSLSWLVSLKCGPPYIVVAPPHLLRQWKSEIYKFLGENTSVHIIKGLKPYDLPLAHVYLIHYLVLRGWKDYLPEFGFNACIFDEIQELRRDGSEKYNGASLIAESVDNVIGLSGTPVYNMGYEIYNVLNILEYHCLGDPFSFRREWCDGDSSTYVTKPAILGDFLKEEGLMLRRRKEEVLSELPPKRRLIQNIDVDAGTFDSMIASVVENAKAIPEIKDAFERGRSLREAINETRMITGIAKAHYVCAFVKTLLEAGETVVLYAHHHRVMDIYMDELKEHYPVMISGRQTAKVKDLSQKAFMDGDTNLIIVSLRSGTGLNLQRARCVVFGELDWSPAVHSQCEDRLHRIGQKDSVLCYYLVCPAGTDMNMQETLGLKTSQFINIMGDKAETEEDKLMAQVDVKKHMKTVLSFLQQGGRKKEIAPEVREGLRKLEKMPKAEEPTSLGDFYEERL